MKEFDPLREELRKLVRLLQRQGVRLIVGGGYGLLLRTEYVRRAGVRTRFPAPGARATNDLDIFLSAEIISDADKMGQIRAALDELGYKPVEGAEFFQFILPIKYAGLPQGVKVDLLAAPARGEDRPKVKMDAVRIRPRRRTGRKLHARTTSEAMTLEERLLEYDIGGIDAGETLLVYLPHPFSYVILKLFALRDRAGEELKGPYHAFDIYRIIAMMTEEEWEQSVEMRDRLTGSDVLAGAREIVRVLFAGPETEGVRLLLTHARAAREELTDEQLREFIADLHELLQS